MIKLSNGTYLNCVASPRAVENLDETAVPWQDLGGFTDIDFTVSGDVRFIYAVTATKTSFVAEALGDTDGDGDRILFVVTESTGPHVIGSYPQDAKLTLTLGTHNDTKD